MLLAGLQKFTLIDYPGKIAASVFTAGCNFLCSFCHNPELVDPFLMKNQPVLSESEIFEFLESRRGDLEGVCITGGEPTLHKDLADFLSKIKSLGFSVKLDTNGSHPEMLEKLIKEKLVDYIAMDIKAPLERYEEITGVANLEKIKKSVELIKNSDIDYEFRTTVVPRFHSKEDIIQIAKEISSPKKPAKKYFLQQFYSIKTLDPELKKEKGYSKEILAEFCEAVKPYFEHCGVRY
ncbi:MAG: anaerobic ribonucleoside-triphosphate reductase activating protein [Candidatus Terrybacteria bacterium]|nr:anaerobic ribonucleoside-triphosphate reductase activating protein [Candidatus Terrybacteria bacterium]